MREVGYIITLVEKVSSVCELRLITWAATYTNCLKVVNLWLALTCLMDVIRYKSGRTLSSFQGQWGSVAPSISAWWITLQVFPKCGPLYSPLSRNLKNWFKIQVPEIYPDKWNQTLWGWNPGVYIFYQDFPVEFEGPPLQFPYTVLWLFHRVARCQWKIFFIRWGTKKLFGWVHSPAIAKSWNEEEQSFLAFAFSQLSIAQKILMPKWHILGWCILAFGKGSLSLSLSPVSWTVPLSTPYDQRQSGEHHSPIPCFLRDCAWIGFLERITLKYTPELICCMDFRHWRDLSSHSRVVPLHPLTFSVCFRCCQSVSALSPTRLGCRFTILFRIMWVFFF